MDKIKSLFLAANPSDTSPLKLDEEIREITKKIRASEYRDQLDFVSIWAVRPDDLLQSLNEHKPQIVHFSGHGSSTGEIVLVNSSGVSKPVSPMAIEALFRTLKDNVRVVILNACYSRIQAEAITKVIDCAVGMKTAIGDQAAITFAASFYRAIGFGRSVEEAFEQGKVALLLEGILEDTTPELLCKPDVDPSKILLVGTHDSDFKDAGDGLSALSSELETYYRMGNFYYASEEFEKSIEMYNKVIRIDPTHYKAIRNRARAFEGLGRWSEAVSDYSLAQQIRPDSKAQASVRLNMACMLQAMGRNEEALSRCQEAIDLYPLYSGAYHLAGEIAEELGKTEDAIDYFSRYMVLAEDKDPRLLLVTERIARLKESKEQ